MVRLKHPDPRANKGEKWGNCVKCGTNRYYPGSQLTRYEGKLYCTTHMQTKGHYFSDQIFFEIDEGDRGEEIG
uniref:Uncharacterized protein n=1 Tax=viral metagenome TaxID=1070528 RepID=A0A6M3IRB5_9ZZZZ